MFITNTGREHALVKTNNLGVIDTGFTANTERYFNGSSYVGGFHNTAGSTFVRKIIKDVDSKIIVVGNFNQFNDTTRNGFLRLNQDGTEDTGFYNSISTILNANFASLNLVDNIVIGEGGKLYLEGTFYDGITTFKIIRLTSSLGLDNTFNGIPVISGAAKLLNVLPDNTLLVQPSTPSTSTSLKLYNNQGIEVSTVATPSLAAGSGVNINTIALDEINKTIYIGGRFDLIQVGSSSNLVRRFITKVI
jgi:hypothetical protein